MSKRIEPLEKPVLILSELFSTPTVTKILDFLLVHRGMDYSLKEMSENTHSSLMSVLRAIPVLEKFKIITINRKVGRSILYILNENSSIMHSLDDLQEEISDFLYLPSKAIDVSPEMVKSYIKAGSKKNSNDRVEVIFNPPDNILSISASQRFKI